MIRKAMFGVLILMAAGAPALADEPGKSTGGYWYGPNDWSPTLREPPSNSNSSGSSSSSGSNSGGSFRTDSNNNNAYYEELQRQAQLRAEQERIAREEQERIAREEAQRKEAIRQAALARKK